MRLSAQYRVATVLVLVSFLAVSTAGLGIVPKAAADSDKWADTCLDANPLSPDDRPWGSFGENERDVFLLDLEEGQQASIEVTYSVSGSANLVAFGVNQYIMARDVGGSMGHFDIEESAHPKYYYNHSSDITLSPPGSYDTQFRKPDAGDVLNARHYVRAHRFSEGTHEFTIKPETDDPICLVLRTDTTGGGSWMLEYSEEKTEEEISKEEQILTLRKTVEAQQTRIAELENGGTNPGTEGESATDGNETNDENSTQDGDDPPPGAKTVYVTPGGGTSGILGMDIPLLWVLGLLAIGVLAARKI